MGAKEALSLMLCAATVLGCAGPKQKPDNTAWQTRSGFRSLGVDERGEIDVSRTLGPGGIFDWVGVRHDLILNPDKKQTPACSCLAVEVGDPGEDRFTWRNGMPEINHYNWAIAVSAFGVECPGGAANPADRRPSIQAVDRVGSDVVVVIEELPPDRPIATGAIIRPPDHGGHVYVRPRYKTLPYAKTSTRELCRVR